MQIPAREVKLTTRTGISVRRTIPHAKLKTIGAWCFVDHFGPTTQTDGMVVAAHPHTGLQTATWLFDGEIEHRDSLGSIQLIRPGQLNLMTAGFGISHSELSLASTETLHAIQLWIALPENARNQAPAFEHQTDLPVIKTSVFEARVLIGEFLGKQAPTTHFTPIMGVELRLEKGLHRLPLRQDFEHGLVLVSGEVRVSGETIGVSSLEYLEPGFSEVEVDVSEDAVMMLLGGEPFPEKILMWWNFIGRSHEEIALAREEWNARTDRFGEFEDQVGGWIPAPEMPNLRLQAR